jgi:hypothetical protein
MSFRNDNDGGYNNIRAIVNLGMGSIYVVIGVIILYVRHFVSVELSPTVAIVLGSAMVLYGLFRLYRGISPFLRKRRF